MQKNINSRGINSTQTKTIIIGVVITTIDIAFKILSIKQPSFWKEGCLKSIACLSLHQNHGIAFSIPIPIGLTIVISIIIILILANLLKKYWNKNIILSSGLVLILFGAIDNLVDRVINNSTTDFLIFFGLSAINFADILILSGIILILWYSRDKDK
ncbi:signal peptidase II [Patescibacteria group bacterium]|nr:signal peptidase II [Patescibacteria group bacterium]MBU4452767.1 signal peptidase II [Patescibacteria group bacterium]